MIATKRTVRRFAFLPVMCNDGSWVWFGYYLILQYLMGEKWYNTGYTERT